VNSYDVAKLPKWAQSRIRVLENSVQYYKDKMLQGDQPGGAIRAHVAHGVVRGLPDETEIEFTMSDGSQVRVSLTDDDSIELMHVYSTYRSRMAVVPRAGNVLEVITADRR